jgi:PGF-pre-PGF domain-containing protein
MVKKGVRSIVVVLIILLVFIIVFSTFANSLSDNKFDSNLNQKYKNIEDKINSEGRARVIIVFEPEDSSVSEDLIKGKSGMKTKSRGKSTLESDLDNDKAISEVSGFNQDLKLGRINGYAGVLTSEGLNDLKNKGLKFTVYEDRIMSVLRTEIKSDGSYRSGIGTLYTLDSCTASVKANYSWNVLNITGRGINISVIDTGIDYTHPDLGGCFGNGTNASCKVFDGYDFYNDESDPFDDHNPGHGTLVSGIIGANGTIRGVASDARLFALKVCDATGNNCPSSLIMAAMEWSLNNSHRAQIISLSLGESPYNTDYGSSGTNLLAEYINNITIQENIIVIVSVGNDGPGISTANNPASAEQAVAVGAINNSGTPETTDDIMKVWSSRGPSAFGRLDPEIVAPGEEVYSTAWSHAYYAASGTSLATPFVSGAAALLLENNPTLTSSQLRAILMQSATDIGNKVFDQGVGELNIQNALTNNIYAMVNHTNTKGVNVVSDRWEFIITPSTIIYANITIYNNNNYNITLNSSILTIANMETSDVLGSSQLKINSSINISNNTAITISINFTLDNFNSVYPTTYGGIILLNGSGDNGTANVSKMIRIPVVITVPIYNYGYIKRNLTEFPSSHYSCYYTPTPKLNTVKINWSNLEDWLVLYSYNSTWGLIQKSNSIGVTEQSISTTNNDTFKWFRVDTNWWGDSTNTSFNLTTPLFFDLNVTVYENTAPIVDVVNPIGGSINSTDNFLFYRPNNLTINITYNETDGDVVNITINDSGYILIDNSSSSSGSGLTGYATFRKTYSSGLTRNNSILITLRDPYGATTTKTLNILLYSLNISINSYSPTNSVIYARQNDSINFTINASDSSNQTLYYYWMINNTINATANNSLSQNQSLIFNTTGYSGTWYQIKAFISNSNTDNNTNETILPWTIYLDNLPPLITIQTPASLLDQSRIDINYTVSDPSPTSGINNCWYIINGTFNGENYTFNSSVSSCTNKYIYLGNGPYTLRVYANDTLGNYNYTSKDFTVNDTYQPVTLVGPSSPSGALSSATTSVTLDITTDENATCRYNPNVDMDYYSMPYNLSDALLEHTTSYAVTAGTNYNIYVRCRDIGNNTNPGSTVIIFSVNAATPPSGNSGGGGSGGGGGGALSDSNLFSKDFAVMQEGESNISIYSSSIPISQLSVNMSNEQYNTTMTITVEENSFDPINESILAYLSINMTPLDEESLLGTKIYFSVKQDWLKENNLTKEQIIMLRYNDKTLEWEALPTEILNENNIVVYYLAISPALGLFAISHNNTKLLMQELNESQIMPELNETENVSNGTDKRNESGELHLQSDKTKTEIKNTTNKSGLINSFSNKISDAVSAIIQQLKNILKNSEDMLWIVWVLSGTFIGILVILMTLRSVSKGTISGDMKHYENELILATNKELKQADKELIKKVPKIPEDLEAIEREVAQKLKEEFTKSINKTEIKRGAIGPRYGSKDENNSLSKYASENKNTSNDKFNKR